MAFVRFVLFLADAVNDFLAKNCTHLAGAISFWTMFSIFPLFLAVISVLGFVLGPRAEEEQLARDIAEFLPVSSDYVSQSIQGVVSARAITGIASVFGLLWAATAAFGAMRKGINAAWGIRKTRPFLKERMIDFGLVLGAGMLMLAVFFSSPILGVMREISFVLAPESEYFTNFIWDLVASLLFPSLTFLSFLILYRYLPNTEVHITDVWPGALLASFAFSGANLGFVWYVRTYPLVYNVVYGSVGAVIALLTWVYLSAIILLFGALLTSRYAAYSASLGARHNNLKILWSGFSRVRLRIVAPTRVA
jgi:membrane protein